MRKFSIPGLSLLILLAILYQSCNKLDKADFRTLVSVQILPDDTVLVIGQSIQFRAIGTFLDSSKRDITEDINWFASPAGLLRMSEKGYANVLDTGDATGTFGLTFGGGASAGNGVDLKNIGAIQLIVDPFASFVSLDLTIDSIKTVPEPSSLGLLGIGLLSAGFAKRRKNKTA